MPTVRAAAYAPDGTEITYDRPSTWDVAGLAQRTDSGRWVELAHGSSYDSVRARATTRAYRGPYMPATVRAVQIYEATAPVVREYFGHHKVSIVQVFKPGQGGWQPVNLHGGWSNIRKLSKQGVTSVAFEGTRNGTRSGPADFEMSSLLKSMNLPKQRPCATVGHSHLPATHTISYDFQNDGETVTELVCVSCEGSYSRRPALTNFKSRPLAV